MKCFHKSDFNILPYFLSASKSTKPSNKRIAYQAHRDRQVFAKAEHVGSDHKTVKRDKVPTKEQTSDRACCSFKFVQDFFISRTCPVVFLVGKWYKKLFSINHFSSFKNNETNFNKAQLTRGNTKKQISYNDFILFMKEKKQLGLLVVPPLAVTEVVCFNNIPEYLSQV